MYQNKPHQITYFIQSKMTGLVKIGKSSDPARRFKSLRTANADEVILLATHENMPEREYHSMFDRFRKHGEWFSIPTKKLDMLLAIIAGESCIENCGYPDCSISCTNKTIVYVPYGVYSEKYLSENF